MEQENRGTFLKYAICFAVDALIVFLVIWAKDFLTHSPAVNLQILADAFFVSGILTVLLALLLYVSGEGALIGVSFVLRYAILAFMPMGRAKWERYADYRERKMERAKERSNRHIFIVGLVFLTVGLILTLIWYKTYYQV